MKDLSEFREPLEVYEAAAGDPTRLAKRLESGANLNGWERSALAALVRGRLVPPKRGRGQRTLPHLATDTVDALRRLRIKNSVTRLRYCMQQLGRRGERYGNFEKVVDHVAEHDRLSSYEVERVLREYRRGREPKADPDTGPDTHIVEMYQRWLLRTGRLPEFPQPVRSPIQQMAILSGYPSVKEYLIDLLEDED